MQQPNRLLRSLTWGITWMFLSANIAPAGPIVLSDTPLVNGLTNNIAPNILFILDDSLSMESEYMPDSISTGFGYDFWDDDRLCVRNFGFNTIHFNPDLTYERPVEADGTLFADADFNQAYDDGFDPGGWEDLGDYVNEYSNSTVVAGTTGPVSGIFRTTNGSRSIRVTHTGHGLEADEADGTDDRVRFTRNNGVTSNFSVGGTTITYNFWYDVRTVIDANTYTILVTNNATSSVTGAGGGNIIINREDYTPVYEPNYTWYYTTYTDDPENPPSSCEDDDEYEQVFIAEQSAAEQQNYANWYQYYRTRLLLMKSASGRAFAGVTSDFRVGFSVISDKGTDTDLFLGVQRFTGTHKEDWYEMLYGIGGASFTPLRAALSKAGRYYAGSLGGDYSSGGDKDPIQYSCQQNFSILTTDGYWNVNDESPVASGFTPSTTTTDGLPVGAATDNYGPFQIDNVTRVGNADGGDAPPYGDTYSNTLADVAAYYYKTDLRPNAGVGGPNDDGDKIDVSTNNVPDSNSDGRTHQRMQTFTLGLGLDGTRAYPGDWAAILDGSLAWPNPITNTTGQRIDDLWHAAVNGRGGYMSAKNAGAVEEQLNDALAAIEIEQGSAAAAATSTLQPVDGDNTAFLAQYETGSWVGNLLAREIDVDTGEIDDTDLWSAQEELDGMVEADDDDRTIYTFSAVESSGLKSFEEANLAAEIAAGYFRSDGFSGHPELSQYDDWSPGQVSTATSQAMIKFLRGQRGHEMSDAEPLPDDEVFRSRTHVLGDIGSAAPVYVRKPPFTYVDDGYAAFVSDNDERPATVYVGANDGMLHAFNGTTGVSGGTERWAYIPSMVIPNLYQLADQDYSTGHRYYVDGPIALGDARDSTGEWATILVGGLGHGGKGYYALDVTDPDSPKALWEFTAADDNDIGFSYGNPIITKRASDGTWVVVFASGYNNGSPGDGKGRLFVVDAFTGIKLLEIITDDLETDESLSGIARVSNYVEDGLRNNSTQYVYGGDLSGNLWRFDINVASCNECATEAARVLLARTTSTADAGVQPITVQPELARIRDASGSWHRVVYFGTGRALGPNDITNLDPSHGESQAIYAVKDTGTYLGVLTESGANLVSQTLREANAAEIAAGDNSRKIDSLTAVDWQVNNGWYVTTPDVERFTVDPGLQLGTLVIAGNIFEQGYCEPTGSTVLYQLDYKSGNVLKTSEYSAQIVGITQLQTRGGAGPVVIDPVFADGTTGNVAQAGAVGGGGSATRVSWREIE